MRLQDNNDQDVGKETVEVKEKEGHQETVDTPLTSPSDELPVQVIIRKMIYFFIYDAFVIYRVFHGKLKLHILTQYL